jgi:hypothetical protein
LLQVAVLATAACMPAPPDSATSLLALGPGWQQIAGGPGTGCSQDSSFTFFVHPDSDRRVAIFFQGGGACWNHQNCDLQGRASFKSDVKPADAPGRGDGMLDLSNPASPIRGYTVVFVPYCTGDVFLGARTVAYTIPRTSSTPERVFHIRHHGIANAEWVLNWVFARVPNPSVIFVAGGSAGAIATPLYASRVARRYPRARVVQLGDGSGGYRSPAIPGLLAQWGATTALRRDTAYRSVDSAGLNFESLYVVAGRTELRVTYAQFNTAEDETQRAYLSVLGMPNARLPQLLAENFADIRSANPRFRSYTAPGEEHVILMDPGFYDLVVDGVALRDWVARLLDGDRVPNVGERLLAPR